MSDMKVVPILNQKGGVGKTTIAIAVSAELTNRDKRVLLIDSDPTQESASEWADHNEGEYFDVVTLSSAQIRNYIERNQDRYDYVIVDCPPRANEETQNLVSNAHLVLIPVHPSPYDVWATRDVCDVINGRRALTAGLPGMPKEGLPFARFLFSKVRRGTRIIRETKEALQDFGFPCLTGMTTDYDIYKRSAISGKTIFDHSERNEKACSEVAELTDEILEVLHGY